MNKFYFKQAIAGLKRNPSRTLLTTLGIVIGIATVIVVLSAGAGFKSYINAQIEVFGSNTVTIETRVPATTRDRAQGGEGGDSAGVAVPITTLKRKDVEDLSRLPNVRGVYGASIGQAVSSYKNISKNAFLFGADAERFVIDRGVIASGRLYSLQEDKALAQVAVLGSKIAEDFFGNENPLGKIIRIGSLNFEVIGVYTPRGSAGFSNDDEQIFIPASTLQKKILGTDYYFYLVASLDDNSKAQITKLSMEDILRQNHQIKDSAKDDFAINTQDENLSTFETILSATTFLLIAIATISLIVGGVGVMNIMYVIVTERISEVGLKKAIGARNKDVLYEFLYEAIMLTLLGGILGIVVGIAASYGIAQIANLFGLTWEFSVPISGILISVIVSTAIGVIFGVFPARNAEKLSPIEALRYEP